jgi:NAD(P)-dependent dehydrogenase (short-subunit alcohol dehydrogenase family)
MNGERTRQPRTGPSAGGSDRLEALARRIAGAGGDVAYAQTDVKRRDDLTSLGNLGCDRYGQLDVLVAEFTDCPICLPIVNAPP